MCDIHFVKTQLYSPLKCQLSEIQINRIIWFHRLGLTWRDNPPKSSLGNAGLYSY